MSPNADRMLQRAQRIPGRLFPAASRRTGTGASQGEQLLLVGQYRTMRHLGIALPALAGVEFRNFSQNGEDGILLVPYADTFSACAADPDLTHGEGCFGASLLAYVRVLRRFGYRLAGANSIDTNAFFIKEGVGEGLFDEVSVESCLSSRWARLQRERWWENLRGRDWVQIDA